MDTETRVVPGLGKAAVLPGAFLPLITVMKNEPHGLTSQTLKIRWDFPKSRRLTSKGLYFVRIGNEVIIPVEGYQSLAYARLASFDLHVALNLPITILGESEAWE